MLIGDLIILGLTQNQSSISHHYRCIHTNRLGGRKKDPTLLLKVSHALCLSISFTCLLHHIVGRSAWAWPLRNGRHGGRGGHHFVAEIWGGQNPCPCFSCCSFYFILFTQCHSKQIGSNSRIHPNTEHNDRSRGLQCDISAENILNTGGLLGWEEETEQRGGWWGERERGGDQENGSGLWKPRLPRAALDSTIWRCLLQKKKVKRRHVGWRGPGPPCLQTVSHILHRLTAWTTGAARGAFPLGCSRQTHGIMCGFICNYNYWDWDTFCVP